MRRITLCLVLLAGSASAQVRDPSGDADLDKAIRICDAHAIYDGPLTGAQSITGQPSRWMDGYDKCAAVWAKWQTASAAQKQKAKADLDAANLLFLSTVAP